MPDIASAPSHFLYDEAAKDAYQTLRSYVFQATQENYKTQPTRAITLMKHDKDKMYGCICGVIVPGWLHITLLWVEPEYRLQGIGSHLLTFMEAEVVQHDIQFAYVWTQAFEAPEFYKKHGYEEFIQLHEFGPTQRLYGLRKTLSPTVST